MNIYFLFVCNYKNYNNYLYYYYIKIFDIFMNKIFKIETFALIIFFIFSIYGYLHIYTDLYFNEYSFNELFINYQAGFVRRGFLGEIFWFLHSLNDLNPRIFFGYLFYFLYIIKILLLYLILKKNFLILNLVNKSTAISLFIQLSLI